MKLDNGITMDLQHFDGGAGGGAGGAGTGSAGAGTGGAAATGTASVTPGTADQGAAPDEAAAKERREKWKATKAEYKDLYGEEVKTQIDDRLKKYKPIEQEHKVLSDRMAKLMELAGVEDPDGLEATLTEQQNKRLEDAAYDKGMSVEEYKAEQQREKDAQAYRQLQARDQFIQRMTVQWQEQAATLQKTYPDFNLNAVMAMNPEFATLLRAGKDVKTAYEVSNAGQILSKNPKFEGFDFASWSPDKAFTALVENGFPIENAFESANLDWTKQQTAKEMEKRVADNIRSGRGRVPESATNMKPGSAKPNSLAGTDAKSRARLMDDFLTGKRKPSDYGM